MLDSIEKCSREFALQRHVKLFQPPLGRIVAASMIYSGGPTGDSVDGSDLPAKFGDGVAGRSAIMDAFPCFCKPKPIQWQPMPRHLMLHPYITASKTIFNIILS